MTRDDSRPLPDPLIDGPEPSGAGGASDPIDDALPDLADDYLWDGRGAPDPDVAQLEALLSPLAYREPLDELRLARGRRRWPVAIGLVAAVAAAAVLVWWVQQSEVDKVEKVELAGRNPTNKTELNSFDASTGGAVTCESSAADVQSWRVTSLAGAPRCGGQALAAPVTLEVGPWLETDADARAEVEVADIGTVVLAPRSRLRRVAAGADQHRLELARGALSATVLAPPRLFLVETPSAVAVDLGCAYTLAVADDGATRLDVTSGYVALETADGAREVFVPAGARCDSRPGIGPGTPYWATASAALRAALVAFDFEGSGSAALADVVALAGANDTVTLWSLLGDARVSRADRARVYERLAALVPPPERATRARLLAGDKTALLWWRLDLEDRWAEASGDDAGAWLPDEWDAWNGADASAATWDAGPATDAADTWSADPAGNAGETWSAGPAGNAGETWGGNAPDARP